MTIDQATSGPAIATVEGMAPGQAQCLLKLSSNPTQPGATRTPGRCPVSNMPVDLRNNMPVESQEPSPGQLITLPTKRVISSIPRPTESTYGHQSNSQENWEYPSPQQFYNALLRKGFNLPEERMLGMVLIHNRLNEDAWKLVLQWESRFHEGEDETAKLELASFSGLHGHLSNKARFYKLGKQFFPSYFTLPDPFDRHDWIVRRPRSGKSARYVIDYYGIRNTGRNTTFVLDVRPALDSFDNAKMRFITVTGRILSCLGTTVSGAVLRLGYLALVLHALFLLAIWIPVYIGRCMSV